MGSSQCCLGAAELRFVTTVVRGSQLSFTNVQPVDSSADLQPELITVLSSAYVVSLTFAGGMGIFSIQRLKWSGERTPPWGTPCLIFLHFDRAPRKSTNVWRPLRQLTKKHFILLLSGSSTMSLIWILWSTVLNARDKSMATMMDLSTGFSLLSPVLMWWVIS